MPVPAKKDRYCATTLRVPKHVYERAKQIVENGETEADSFNDFVVDALKERLRVLREREIDAAIAGIANDADYRESAIRMAREFERSDWDAFRAESETINPAHKKASATEAGEGRRLQSASRSNRRKRAGR